LQHSEYYGAVHIVFLRFAGVPHLSYFTASKNLEFEGLEMSVSHGVDHHDIH
jgi:hypothetical protein